MSLGPGMWVTCVSQEVCECVMCLHVSMSSTEVKLASFGEKRRACPGLNFWSPYPSHAQKDTVGLLLLSSTRTGQVGLWEWAKNIPDPQSPSANRMHAQPPRLLG